MTSTPFPPWPVNTLDVRVLKRAAVMRKKIDRHRKLLLAERARLLSACGVTAGDLRQTEQLGKDDWGPYLNDRFVSSQVRGLNRQKLCLVETALARLESGEYGVCVECEKAISPNRLTAVPWARYCVGCEGRMARTGFEPQDSAL